MPGGHSASGGEAAGTQEVTGSDVLSPAQFAATTQSELSADLPDPSRRTHTNPQAETIQTANSGVSSLTQSQPQGLTVTPPQDFAPTAEGAEVEGANRSTATTEIELSEQAVPVNKGGVGAIADSDASPNLLPENAGPGTPVGITASAIDPDGTDSVTYSLMQDFGGLFTIDSQTGQILLSGQLDAEKVSSYQIQVVATSSDGSTSTQSFVINVADVDEFDVTNIDDRDSAANTVSEAAANGTAVGITAFATDGDATNNAVTFSLVDAHGDPVTGGPFAIDANTGVVTVADNSQLDYETAASHTIYVKATSEDGSSAMHSFTIALSDANEDGSGAISDIDAAANAVSEDAAPGTVAGITAFASDPDGTDAITYSLTDDAGGRFTIDPHTGVVTVAGGLDRESAASYTIEVTATSTDGSIESRNFTIAVDDANEFAVTAPVDSDGTANLISEAAANGTAVGITAFAHDGDVTHSTVTYSLVDADGVPATGGAFAIDPVTGVVTVADSSKLDYETAASQTIHVKATSEDGSTATQSFTVNIADLLEAPELTATAAHGAEDVPLDLGSHIALDRHGQAGAMSVQISGVPAGATLSAGIETSPGVWTLTPADLTGLSMTPPANSDANFTLTVTASIADAQGHIAATTTHLDVALDAVADTPVLSRDHHDASEIILHVSGDQYEGSPNLRLTVDGKVVGNWTITADHRTGEWQDIRVTGNFGAAGPHEVSVAFTNDRYSGTPILDRNLIVDRIEVNGKVYESEAPGVVYDRGYNVAGQETMYWNGKMTFDTSDNGGPNARISGAEDSAIALDLHSALTDTDGSETLTVTISGLPAGAYLSAGTHNADGSWTLSAGQLNGLTLTPPANFSGDFSLTVQATASEGANDNQATSSMIVPVHVRAMNDDGGIGAVTDIDAGANAVDENAAVGTTVGVTAFATDPDSTDTITYSLSDNAGGRFAIDPHSGVITVAGAINREAAASYTVEVKATSSDGSSSTSKVTIDVNDLNEFSVKTPVDADTTANSVSEGAANGTTVGLTAFATDADATNNTVTYALVNANGVPVTGGPFAIDGMTGVVTVADNSQLNYEAATSHTIYVKATSADGSTATRSFSIGVTDVDEFDVTTPIDKNAAANVVSEGAANGAAVGITAFASDADRSQNSVTYSLVDANGAPVAGGPFAVNATTGVVTVADRTQLNYEAATSHTVYVQAASADGSTATQSFTINVTDVDEFDVTAPIDSNAAPNVVSEGAANGTAVGITAFASDADGSKNAVTYSLVNANGAAIANGPFAINANTGVVTVANGAQLNYEAATSHTIYVKATSADGSTAVQSFTVNVADANEFSVTTPVDSNSAVNTVSEAAANGTAVGITTFAVDADGSNNAVSYSLVNASGAPVTGGAFAIDSHTGVVTVADHAQLDYERATSETLYVKATSADGSSATGSFTVNVTNANEAPVASAIPDQTANAGGAISFNTASYFSDPDAGDTKSYSISGPQWLHIDQHTGVISGTAPTVVTDLQMSGGLYHLPSSGIVEIDTDMLSSDAGYNNSIGYYLADANGKPLSGELINLNVKDFADHHIDIDLSQNPGAASLGFFLMPNGANISHSVTDGSDISFVSTPSGWQAVWGPNGETYNPLFSDTSLNAGGTSYVTNNATEGNLNWEDIRIGGDRDFNDVNMNATVRVISADPSAADHVTVTVTDHGGLQASTSFELIHHENGVLMGTAGADTLTGSSSADAIFGGDGNDTVYGGSGHDTLFGGAGNDTLYGGGDGHNLIVNGSFEDPALSHWAHFTSIPGWHAAQGNIEIDDNYAMPNHASDGHQFMEIDASSAQVDDVYQDVQTVSGQEYTLSLDVAARSGTGLSTNTIGVYWNNALVRSIDPASTDWETHQFKVVGTGGLDRLEFREQAGDNDSYGGLIDNVSLVAVDSSHDVLQGGDGNDTIYGGLGDDTLYGNDGSDLFMFAKGDGSDTIYGGAGSGWTDTIQMSGVHQGYAPDTPGSDWTVHLTEGSVAANDADGLTLSQDADGTIHFNDGSSIVFHDIERIEWH
jgi:hypothetical protein